MELIITKTLFSTFAVVFTYILLGRLVAAHAAPRLAYLTPLASLLTGLGFWLFWFVGLGGAVGASLDITTYLFGGGVLLLVAVMFQTFQAFRGVEHFWSNLVASALLSFPLWQVLAGDTPQLSQELAGTVKTLADVAAMGKLPHAEQAALYGVAGITDMPGTWAAIFPVIVLAQGMVPGAFAVFNLLVLLCAAGSLVQAAGMNVRWSNLPLISAGSLLGLTLLNPFFAPETIHAALPDMTIAAGLLMLAMPLLSQGALPTGVAVLPTAFTAVVVALASEQTWPLLFVLGVFWGLRTLSIERFLVKGRVVFGWVSLLTLPLLAVLFWREYPLRADLVARAMPDVAVVPWLLPLAYGVAGIVFLGAVYMGWMLVNTRQKPEVWVLQMSWLVAAALLVVVWLEPSLPLPRGLVWLQFLLLLPLWRLWTFYYQKTPLRTLAYKSPWGVGGVLAGCVVVMVLVTMPVWQPKAPLALGHAEMVSHSLTRDYEVRLGKKVAVLDAQVGPVAAMAYALQGRGMVLPALPSFELSQGNRAMFHAQLQEQGAGYLWVNHADEQVQFLFQREFRPEASYLFEVADGRFKLLQTYPHLTYTDSGW